MQLRDAVCHPGTSGRQSSRWPRRQQSLRVASTATGYAEGPPGDVVWPAQLWDTQWAIRERQAQAASPAAGLRGGGPHTCFAGTAPWGPGHCVQLTLKHRPGQSGCWDEATQAGGGTDSACQGARAPSRAAMTGRAQKVPTSPSRISVIRRGGSAEGRQRLRQAGVLTPRAVESLQIALRNPNGTPKPTPKGFTSRGP